jgi:uncharacterized membrane protein YgcG
MIRKVALLLAALAVGAGTTLVAAAPANATPNVLGAKLYAGQAIDVQRSPAFPVCTNATTFSPITLSFFQQPYSDNGSFALGTNYLKLNPSGDALHPWKLTLYNSSDQELRYTGSAWVTSADPGFATADEWNTGGEVYGLYEDGYFFNSYPAGNGTFVSLSAPAADPTTYTPLAAYNDCLADDAAGGFAAKAKTSVIESSGGGGGGGGGDGGGDGDGGGSADSGSGSPAAEPTMPDTGASVRTVVTVSVSAALIFGFAFFVYASRRKLRFAWTNDRIASLMDDLDSRLTGLEQRARAAAARRKLRK